MSLEVNKGIVALVGNVRMAEDTVEYLKYVPAGRLLEVLGYHKTSDHKLPAVLCFESNGFDKVLDVSKVYFNHGEYRITEDGKECIIYPTFYVRVNKPLLGVMPETMRNDLR